MADDLDEVALNTLLAEGIDAPTAFVASQRDKPRNPWPFLALVALVAFVLWFLLA
jgi:hypothetical protein